MFIQDSVYSQRSVADVKSPVSCFSPNLVYNPYLGDYVVVPCRTCAACRSSYAHDLQLRIEQECKSHKFNFFITLTYDNMHMPMYYAYPSENGVFFKAFRGNKPLLDAKGEELPELDFDLEDSWYADPQNNPFQTGFGFCHKPDIQKFIKRLRIKLIRTYGNVSQSKIRYFIASEYGPCTFRPHYHGVIFCDDERMPETCRGLYVRLGRSVLLSDAMFSSSAVPLLSTLRNMLMALHLCLKFYQLNLPARSIWQVKTQLWALSKLTKRKYLTASLTMLLSDLRLMLKRAKFPLLYFPSKFYLDTSASIADMAIVILIMNYGYIKSMNQATTEKSTIQKTTDM